MHFKETHRPHVLVRKPIHVFFHLLFGLPFLGFGMLVVLVGVLGDEEIPIVAVILFGGVCGILGLLGLFSRFGTVLDGQRRTVTKWFSFLGIRWAKETPVAGDARVSVSHEKRQRSSGSGRSRGRGRSRRRSSSTQTYSVYPVRLEGTFGDEGGFSTLDLHTLHSFQDARSTAKQVAKLFNLDVVDRASGEDEIVRERGAWDESLREQHQRTGQPVEVPDPPPGTNVQYQVKGDELVLSLPKKETVTASADRLRVERGRFWPGVAEIPADKIEELVRNGRTGAIEARGDRAIIKFGKNLRSEEKRWIYALVLRVLTA